MLPNHHSLRKSSRRKEYKAKCIRNLQQYRDEGIGSQYDIASAAYIVYWVANHVCLMADNEVRSAHDKVLDMVRGYCDLDLISLDAEWAIEGAEDASFNCIGHEHYDMIRLTGLFERIARISAYEYAGFPFSPVLKTEYQATLLRNFRTSPKYFRTGAVRMAEPWMADFWWLQDVLSKRMLDQLRRERIEEEREVAELLAEIRAKDLEEN